MSMHYDSESLVDRGRSPRLFALLVTAEKDPFLCNIIFFWGISGYSKIDQHLHKTQHLIIINIKIFCF